MAKDLTLEECHILLEKFGEQVYDLLSDQYVRAIQREYDHKTPKRNERLEIQVGLRGAGSSKNTINNYAVFDSYDEISDTEYQTVYMKFGHKNDTKWEYTGDFEARMPKKQGGSKPKQTASQACMHERKPQKTSTESELERAIALLERLKSQQ